jgi:hypothetical protein
MGKRAGATPTRIVVSGLVNVTKPGSRGEAVITDPQQLAPLNGWVYDEENCTEHFDESLANLGLTGGTLALAWDAKASALMLITEYQSPRKLAPEELKRLVRETEGQWSDGIGGHCFDGLEQQFDCSVEYSLKLASAKQLAATSVKKNPCQLSA